MFFYVLTFIGHELRREGRIKRNLLDAEMAGKRSRGRQRLKVLDIMMERLRVIDGKHLSKIARDRTRWRDIVLP